MQNPRISLLKSLYLRTYVLDLIPKSYTLNPKPSLNPRFYRGSCKGFLKDPVKGTLRLIATVVGSQVQAQ